MAVSRASADLIRAPHLVSLKVLRLSRPTLSAQHPLSEEQDADTYKIDPKAALAYPSADQDGQFVLTSGVRLPAAFGMAHVGETFACTLCVNNEVPLESSDLAVTDVRITADMQTPLQPASPIQLDVETATDSGSFVEALGAGQTLQGIVRFHLSDEGNYILAVTVTYVEVQKAKEDGAPSMRRSRTFRKLYQFPASQLLRVRIKTRPLPADSKHRQDRGYAVQAQLEKLGDDSLVLESANLNAKAAFEVTPFDSWNKKMAKGSGEMLNPGDVLQKAFLLVQRSEELEMTQDGRIILGQMTIKWRGAMGEAGLLHTGWLSGRP